MNLAAHLDRWLKILQEGTELVEEFGGLLWFELKL